MASHDIIVIGGSLGAIDALRRICAGLPSDVPAAVLVVIHIGQQHWNPVSSLRDCSLRVVAAEDGAPVERGMMYVAPPAHHLLVIDGAVRLGRGPARIWRALRSIRCFVPPPSATGHASSHWCSPACSMTVRQDLRP